MRWWSSVNWESWGGVKREREDGMCVSACACVCVLFLVGLPPRFANRKTSSGPIATRTGLRLTPASSNDGHTAARRVKVTARPPRFRSRDSEETRVRCGATSRAMDVTAAPSTSTTLSFVVTTLVGEVGVKGERGGRTRYQQCPTCCMLRYQASPM